jgi:hypothetical protein
MVTSEGNWLVGRKLFESSGFTLVDHAPPEYELLAKDLGPAAPPLFPNDRDRRAASFGKGLTVVRSDQCPYLDDAVDTALEAARVRGIPASVVELTTARDIRERVPSPYGVFAIVLDGEVVSHYYRPKKKLNELLDASESL